MDRHGRISRQLYTRPYSVRVRELDAWEEVHDQLVNEDRDLPHACEVVCFTAYRRVRRLSKAPHTRPRPYHCSKGAR